jgi:hypothetical protein
MAETPSLLSPPLAKISSENRYRVACPTEHDVWGPCYRRKQSSFDLLINIRTGSKEDVLTLHFEVCLPPQADSDSINQDVG